MKTLFLLVLLTLTAHAWTPPKGIPDPADTWTGFGEIDQATPAWPASWLTGSTTPTAGYYFVDNTDPAATNGTDPTTGTTNTYGHPDTPRLTLPEGTMTGARMIYVHAGDYAAAGGDRFDWNGVFSAAQPLWITGNPTTRPRFTGEKIHIGDGASGLDTSWIVFENFQLTGSYPSLSIQPRSLVDGVQISNVLVRNIVRTGTQTNSDNGGIAVGQSTNSGQATNSSTTNVVLYNNVIRNIGARDPSEASPPLFAPDDSTGVYTGFVTHHTWVVDNNIYAVAADSVAGSHYSNYTTQTTEDYYIGRNRLGNVGDQGLNGENGIDLKNVTRAVISENIIRGPFMREQGGAIVLHYGALTEFHCRDIAVIFNDISHCTGGIGGGSSGFDNALIIGNLFYDIKRSYVAPIYGANDVLNGTCIQSYGTASGSNSVQLIVDNTFYDYERGLYLGPKAGDSFKAHGNIFSQRAAPSSPNGSQANYGEFEVTNGTESRVSTNYNLYHGTPVFFWANANRDLAYMQGTASQEANAATGDPLFTLPGSGDFTLGSPSPATGVSVEGPVGGTAYDAFFTLFGVAIEKDYSGTARPAGGSWDMGAYEFGSTFVDFTPPTLTSATIPIGGTTLVLAFSETVGLGAGGSGGLALSLSSGSVTASYASGAGTLSLTYNLSGTVVAGVTGTVAYTQPGSGIEDVTGNDLTTLSGLSITNNSSQSFPAIPRLRDKPAMKRSILLSR